MQFRRAGRLAWGERPAPELVEPTDALVRPFIAGRCDGDTVPLHRPVSRALQLGIAVRAIDPVVACICGRVPFRGPFAIGHEGVGRWSRSARTPAGWPCGQTVVVPWAVSCGRCDRCRAGLTSKCATTTSGELAAFGFGPAPARGADGQRPGPCPVRRPHARAVPDAVRRSASPQPATISPMPGAASSSRSVRAPADACSSSAAAPRASASTPPASRWRTARPPSTTTTTTPARRAIAESSAPARRRAAGPRETYDVAVEATSRAAGLRTALRALAPGGVCTAVGYYMATGTRVPLMQMYATDATLRLGVSHARALIPDVLAFIAETGFEAERVTSLTADSDDAPSAYLAKTTKVVLAREPPQSSSTVRSSSLRRSGSARMSISTIFPPAIVKPRTEKGLPSGAETAPRAPFTSAGRANRPSA